MRFIRSNDNTVYFVKMQIHRKFQKNVFSFVCDYLFIYLFIYL